MRKVYAETSSKTIDITHKRIEIIIGVVHSCNFNRQVDIRWWRIRWLPKIMESESEQSVISVCYTVLMNCWGISRQILQTICPVNWNASVYSSYSKPLDNLDGSIERGYMPGGSGMSFLWKVKDQDRWSSNYRQLSMLSWRNMPDTNASIGINGTVINNVNASLRYLQMYI